MPVGVRGSGSNQGGGSTLNRFWLFKHKNSMGMEHVEYNVDPTLHKRHATHTHTHIPQVSSTVVWHALSACVLLVG